MNNYSKYDYKSIITNLTTKRDKLVERKTVLTELLILFTLFAFVVPTAIYFYYDSVTLIAAIILFLGFLVLLLILASMMDMCSKEIAIVNKTIRKREKFYNKYLNNPCRITVDSMLKKRSFDEKA